MGRSPGRGVLVLVLVWAAACGGDDRAAVPAAATVPSTAAAGEVLSVEVERSRLFEQQRSLGVTLRNDGSTDVVVDGVSFGDGPYEPGPDAGRTVTVPAGAVVSFPVPYGDERCGAVGDQLVVHLDVDGDPTSRTVPVSGQVRRAHGRACAAAAAGRAVVLGFDDDWQLVAPRKAQGSLVAEPRAGHVVEVVDVSSSIVFVTEPSGPSGGPAVPLEVFAARCDTHALIESKKTFTFTVSVVIDGAAPVPVEIVPEDGTARDVLQKAIEGCIDDGESG